MELVNQIGDQREGVFVEYGVVIQFFVVLYYTIVPVLFLDQKGRGRIWRFGWLDESLLEFFV